MILAFPGTKSIIDPDKDVRLRYRKVWHSFVNKFTENIKLPQTLSSVK